jgi:hypothetical protein
VLPDPRRRSGSASSRASSASRTSPPGARFPSRILLPARWADDYWRLIPTRRIANPAPHGATYAA